MKDIKKLIREVLNNINEKEDRCKRIADRKYDKPSAYKSGAIVRCRKGNIWKDLKEVVLSSLVNIDPYNNPDDEYAQDLDSYLEDDNIDWKKESYITLINPNQIQPSEWNSLSNDPKNSKSIKYSKVDPSKFPPILALKTGPNSYEAIDGIHRVYAFRLNNHMIPAIVITPKLEQGLSTSDTQMVNFMYNKYKDSNIPTPTKINNLKEYDDLSIKNRYISADGDDIDNEQIKDDLIKIKPYFKSLLPNYINGKPLTDDQIDQLIEQFTDNLADIWGSSWMTDEDDLKLKGIWGKADINDLADRFVDYVDGVDWEEYPLNEDESLHKWFKRQGAPGKEGGWVDCNSPIRKDGKITGYKTCGRKEGEKRAKYPSCRPTPAQCKSPGKGKKWGKTK
jgi:hypothetical protein